MTTRLRFPSWEAVEALLRAQRLPPSVVMAPAAVGRDDDGVWLDAALDAATLRVLRDDSVAMETPVGPGRPVSCWAEALPLQRHRPGDSPRVLFQVPLDQLLPLAGELVRLGCDKQKWARTGNVAWIEAIEPPWYSVLSVLEGTTGRVFEPVSPDVWIELGATHPLADQLTPSDGALLLVGAPWQTLPTPTWTSLYDRLDLQLPGVNTHAGNEELPSLKVRFRLVDSGRLQPPSLWVLRDNGVAQIETLLGHLPDDLVQRLLFAVAGDLVVLRARPSVLGPPTLEVRGERYAPLLELPNLFRPVDSTLEPPLRRDRIREVLAPEPFEVAWLARAGEGFGVERIAESAFKPLSDWVDYVVARDEIALSGWAQAATFAFEDFVDVGVEWSDRAPETRPRKAVVEVPEPTAVPDKPAPTMPRTVVERALTPRAVEVVADQARSGLASELVAAEKQFKDLDADAGSPERLALWQTMATLHRKLGNGREASLCWVHAVWEQPSLAVAWAEEELGAVNLEVEALREAVLDDPTVDRLRAVGAALAAGELGGDAALSPLFDRNSDVLDVRTAWLAREQISGDDDLARARARDDVLGRIRQGLQVERDVPGFIRSYDAEDAAGVVPHLEAQLAHFRKTRRKRSVIEADPALTQIYVDLVFAWGFASVGERERARTLLGSAAALDRSDPVHDVLVTSYEARIEQALQGLPRETPLPAEASAKLLGLSSFHRYQVDRMRSASGILETSERLDPFKTFERRFEDPRGPEFAALRGVEDPSVLRPALAEIVASAKDHEEQERLLDGAFDFLPLLSAVDALPLLDGLVVQVRTLALQPQVRLLTDALMVAGLLGRTARTRQLAGQVKEAIEQLAPTELDAVTEVLSASLRSLRRVGLQDEARELLESVRRGLVVDPSNPEVLRDDLASRRIRAGAVGGLLALRTPGALDELDGLLAGLDDKLAVPKRLKLTRSLGVALSAAPRAEAFERLPALSAHLKGITDSFNTNSHFCLSVVSYAESVVLGYADTELGSRARAWIDASEFRVRRRIHES